MTGFLAKYWKKIGLVVVGFFLTLQPYLFMLYVGIIIGHFVTSRFAWKLDVKVVAPLPKRKGVKANADILDEEELDAEPVVKKAAKALPTFEATPQEKEETA
jgi:hypothetical protein